MKHEPWCASWSDCNCHEVEDMANALAIAGKDERTMNFKVKYENDKFTRETTLSAAECLAITDAAAAAYDARYKVCTGYTWAAVSAGERKQWLEAIVAALNSITQSGQFK